MELKFPLLDGGQEHGLNDAGVEAFSGSVGQYVVRECAQNSGDAAVSPKAVVRVVFEMQTVKSSDLPCVDQLAAALHACRAYWSHDQKTRTFFDRALKEIGSDAIPVLRVGDYGTTGLSGSDIDRTKGWYALVKSQGVSVKDDTAGGSFGIGKSSPFAASRFRTVFYSTKTLGGDVAFQGVSRLVTHELPSGNATQSVGFIGGYTARDGKRDPVFTAIRDPDEIPPMFLRDETGTDLFIPGYFTDEPWERELAVAILDSFWPAIHRGSMVFQIGEREISSGNLAEWIDRFKKLPDFTAHLYFGALAGKNKVEHKAVLPVAGKCRLYLTTEGVDLPKDVCRTRLAGMIIDRYGPSNMRRPYAGLFICEDKEGNQLLRQMEPPRHDRWDPKRGGAKGKQALSQIRKWIREKVKELNPTVDGDTFNEEDLGKYLPELEEPGTSTAGESDQPGQEPGAYGMPRPTPSEPHPVPVDLGGAPGGVSAAGADEGEAVGGSSGTPSPKGGDGKNTGGRVRRRGSGSKPSAPPISLRAYAADERGGVYTMVLRTAQDFTGTVELLAAGDDETDNNVEIESCSIEGGEQQLDVSGNRIRNVTVTAETPLRLRISLRKARRTSFVIAHQ